MLRGGLGDDLLYHIRNVQAPPQNLPAVNSMLSFELASADHGVSGRPVRAKSSLGFPTPIRWVAHLLAVALFFMFVSGCGREPQRNLRLAINPWPGSEFLYLAKVKGFLATEGLDVRLVEYASLSDCRVAFETGQVDAMAGTLIEVLQAKENSQRNCDLVLVTDYSNGADVILGRSDLPSISSLRGRRVGLELGSLGGFMLSRALALNGLKITDVEIVSCAPGDMEAALASGRVDAVVTYPPTSIALEAGGRMRRLFSSAEIPNEVVDIVAVDPSFLQRQPGMTASLHRSFQRALDYAHDHPQDAYAIMGQREGLSAREFEQALAGLQLVDMAGQKAFLGPQGSLIRSLADVERALRSAGQLHGNEPTASPAPPSGKAN